MFQYLHCTAQHYGGASVTVVPLTIGAQGNETTERTEGSEGEKITP
jgi:hypothetical protein